MKTYTHQFFGEGYKIIHRDIDDWCELRKEFEDGSYSLTGDYFENLVEEKPA